MNSLLRSCAKRIPGVKRVVAQRDALAAELMRVTAARDSLLAEKEGLKQWIDHLTLEQRHVASRDQDVDTTTARRLTLERSPHSPLAAIMKVSENGQSILSRCVDVSYELVYKMLAEYEFSNLLDVGSGRREHAEIFSAMGKKVTTLDAVFDADYQMDFLDLSEDITFDAIHCSHVLEHQRNIGLFCDKLFCHLETDGILGISVPPECHHYFCFEHPNHFNAGFLIYHLVMAGFDCRETSILTYGYNVSVVLKKRDNHLPRVSYALGRDDVLPFFPSVLRPEKEQVCGRVLEHNWRSILGMKPHPSSS